MPAERESLLSRDVVELRVKFFSVLSLYSSSACSAASPHSAEARRVVTCPLLSWILIQLASTTCPTQKHILALEKCVPFSSGKLQWLQHHPHTISLQIVAPAPSALPTFRSVHNGCLMHIATACPHRHPEHDTCSATGPTDLSLLFVLLLLPLFLWTLPSAAGLV